MKKFRDRKNGRGQAMTEFVIALPILLLVIFGIIEFGRLTFAWMAVQNAARFGIRYAVTGEFKSEYCDEAGNYLGADYISADTDGGDPQDCLVPDTYTGSNGGEKERELIDIARLFSIRDAAVGGGSGLWLRQDISGDYYQFLATHNPSQLGQIHEDGYIHVTVCSNRQNQFAMDRNNYAIPLCVDNVNGVLMDDAGGPGDRVKVHVEHRHPMFLPLLTSLWPNLGLNAERDGIVEKFRTSRVLGVSGPIQSAPTWTQTPTITNTPTVTETPLPTATYTPVPTAFSCSGSGILREYWTGISGNDLSNLTGNPNYPLAPSGNSIQGSFEAPVNWDDNYGTRMRAWLCIPQPGNYEFWIASDDDSKLLLDCSGTDPLIVGDANPGGAGQIAFVNGWTSSQEWDKYSSQRSAKISVGTGGWNCYIEALHKEGSGGDNLAVSWNGPHIPNRSVISSEYLIPLSAAPTQLPTATPTITPTPDCSAYSMGNFSFSNWAIQSLTVTNGDLVDTEVSRIVLDWSYAEQFGAANGHANLNVDWFQWGGSTIWGDGNGGARDYASDTDTSVDSSSTWNGPKPFNAGSSYSFKIDFDGDWGAGGSLTNVTSDDFGVVIQFANGCQLNRAANPQPIITWTPSHTPTITPTPTPPPPPTDTLVPSITPTASDTPTASNTPPPTHTPPPPTITPTPKPPTNTPLPTTTPVPSDTGTPAPATSTNTPVPPTSTEEPTWTPACPYDDPNWPCQPTWTPTP